MLRATHLILSTYGFWLPNDPRGSWSTIVRSAALLRHGPATKVSGNENVAAKPHDREKREAAKRSLKYPPVVFTADQARCVGDGFARAVEESNYRVYACAILEEHVHVVVQAHRNKARQIAAHLKGRATQQLKREGLHPLADFADEEGNLPSPWSQKPWKVYIYTMSHLKNAIRYAENNPEKEGKPRQRWTFVKPLTDDEAAVNG